MLQETRIAAFVLLFMYADGLSHGPTHNLTMEGLKIQCSKRFLENGRASLPTANKCNIIAYKSNVITSCTVVAVEC